MKNLFPSFAKLVAVAACALTLGSCSRAEYAMLPKGGSYHGVTRVATPVPAATPAPALAAALVAATPVATTELPMAAAPVQIAKQQAQAVAPVAVASTSGTASTVAATPAPKLNVMQRLALNKVTRKVDKLMQKATARQHDNTASTARGGISGNLRTGLIFLLVGLLISLFSGISGIFGIIGAIVALIGLVFIILWLLDQA
jgi:hypothetical protein